MSDLAAKAEKSIASTCKNMGVTEMGRRWFDLCVDPFKDLNMPTAGYPDTVTTPSVIQTIHDSLVVTAPGAFNWDCNIFIDPLYIGAGLVQTPSSTNPNVKIRSGQGAFSYPRGGLIIRSAAANTPLDFTTATASLGFKTDAVAQCDFRVIGLGLEIHNTTAEINLQGALITYRVPSADLEEVTVTLVDTDSGATSCTPTALKTYVLPAPPTTAAEAIDMPGSLQWEAKHGAYIVPRIVAPSLPPVSLEFVGMLTAEGQFNVISAIGANKLMHAGSFSAPTGFSCSGVYLTGLSASTTLQVNLTYYVEVFPYKENVLRRSVQPTPGLDAAALKLYNYVSEKLPTGVPVADNSLGTFISGVARIASGVFRAIPGIARQIGGAVNVVSSIADAMDFGRSANHLPNNNIVELRGQYIPNNNALEVVNRRHLALSNQERNVPIPGPDRNEIVIRESRRGNLVEEVRRSGTNVAVNNGARRTKTDKAKRRYNKILQLAEQGQAGNRWADVKK